MPNQVAEVLRKALAAFGPNGENWTQGKDSFNAPRCCAVLAFNRVDNDTLPDDLTNAALTVISNAAGFECESYNISDSALEEWNDAPERTFAEVKELFEKAIAKAEKNQ